MKIIKTLLDSKTLIPHRNLTTKFTPSIMQCIELSHTIGIDKFNIKFMLNCISDEHIFIHPH